MYTTQSTLYICIKIAFDLQNDQNQFFLLMNTKNYFKGLTYLLEILQMEFFLQKCDADYLNPSQYQRRKCDCHFTHLHGLAFQHLNMN